MLTLDPDRSTLLVIDVQSRLMPAIDRGADIVRNAGRLVEAAKMLGVPILATEQNARGLGRTVEQLPLPADIIVPKMTFDSVRAPDFLARLDPRHDLVTLGCEAHVCVLQTVLGLIDAGRRVFVVADAIGSRVADNKTAAIRRMERHGAEIVTTEMVLFEWLATAEHPSFREAVALIR